MNFQTDLECPHRRPLVFYSMLINLNPQWCPSPLRPRRHHHRVPCCHRISYLIGEFIAMVHHQDLHLHLRLNSFNAPRLPWAPYFPSLEANLFGYKDRACLHLRPTYDSCPLPAVSDQQRTLPHTRLPYRLALTRHIMAKNAKGENFLPYPSRRILPLPVHQFPLTAIFLTTVPLPVTSLRPPTKAQISRLELTIKRRLLTLPSSTRSRKR